jgi:putative ABC transport system permease protein
MASMLYGISATDPPTIICVTVLLAVSAMFACCLPAIKATRIDPVDAIRTL